MELNLKVNANNSGINQPITFKIGSYGVSMKANRLMRSPLTENQMAQGCQNDVILRRNLYTEENQTCQRN